MRCIVAVLAGEQQPRPVVAAVGVGDPVRLVEDEHLAARRGLLDGAADDGREGVDLLLAGGQADGALGQQGGELRVGLVRQLAQRRGVDAGAGGGQGLQRLVGLAGVGGAEVEDDVLGPGGAGRQRGLGALDPALLRQLLGAGGGAVGVAGGGLAAGGALAAAAPGRVRGGEWTGSRASSVLRKGSSGARGRRRRRRTVAVSNSGSRRVHARGPVSGPARTTSIVHCAGPDLRPHRRVRPWDPAGRRGVTPARRPRTPRGRRARPRPAQPRRGAAPGRSGTPAAGRRAGGVGAVHGLQVHVRLRGVARVAARAERLALRHPPARPPPRTDPRRRWASSTNAPPSASSRTTWLPAMAAGPPRIRLAWVSA